MVSTDDREIALGILRALRRRQPVVCFATGHGEYDIDNFEFHTHFEGAQGHSHNSEGTGVVQMEQHGLGRLRRAIEKLGLATRKVDAGGRPAGAGRLRRAGRCQSAHAATRRPRPISCAATCRPAVPTCCWSSPTMRSRPAWRRCLPRPAPGSGDGVVVDPVDHYFTDEQMIAVTRYANHPVTRSQALSFYPGARPVEPAPADGVKATALFASGPQSYVVHDRLRYREEAAAARAACTTAGRRRPRAGWPAAAGGRSG